MTATTPFTLAPAQNLPAHPVWCDPRACATYPDGDDELLVMHRTVVFDEPMPDGDRLVVDVVRGDVLCPRGGEPLARDKAGVRVRGVDHYTELKHVMIKHT